MVRVQANQMAKTRKTQGSPQLPELSPPNSDGPWLRLALTIAPFVIYVLATQITLPGIDAPTLERRGGSSETYSIVALGIVPWVTAHMLVELVAVLVPRWRHLRHGGVVGRAKLQRATTIAGVLIAGFQAYSMAVSLQSTSFLFHAGIGPMLLMWVTLLAGTIFIKLLADFVSRRGLANGYGFFLATNIVLASGRLLARDKHMLTGTDVLGLVGKVVACGVLTWFVLTRLSSLRMAETSEKAPVKAVAETDIENPYAAPNEQHASPGGSLPYAESMFRQLPTVASGLLPLTVVRSVLVAQTAFHDSIPGMHAFKVWLTSGKTSGLASLFLLFACTWICTRLFNQPQRVAKVYTRLTGSPTSEPIIAGEAQEASRHAFVHALLFLVGLLMIDLATQKVTTLVLGMEAVTFAVVLGLDMVNEFRTLNARKDLVAVWPEHRPYALAAARMALAKEGVFLHVRDEHQKRLYQFTVPYIPMEMYVPHADAERAAKILEKVLLEKPQNTAEANERPMLVAPRRPLQPWALALVALFSVGTVGLSWPVTKPAAARAARTTKLEFVLVDDEQTIANDETKELAEKTHRLRFHDEQVYVGVGKLVGRRYAVAEVLAGETLDAARQRLEAWAKTITLPAGVRVAVGEYQQYDQVQERMVVSGWRTYLLQGSAMLTEADVAHAKAIPDPNRDMSGWLVQLEFTPEGAERFERVTGENIKRRFAIMLDGQVKSAPVIQSKIPGGFATITMGNADVEQQKADAQNLEKAINGD